MQHAFGEMLGSHVIVTGLAASVILASAFGVVGPIGFYTVASPVGRIAQSLLYVVICYPTFYGGFALLFYFLRFRSPLEVLSALTFFTPLVAFQCTAVIYTIETLARAGAAAEAGFGEVLFQVILASLIAVYLCFYVVWQRTRHARRAGARRDAPPAGPDANEAAARPGRETAGGQPAAGRDESADAPVRPHGDAPVTMQPAASGPAAATGATAADAPGNLLKLLPGRLGTDLVYVKSEDHYLEVHTTVGSSLIKMRFSDAVAELGDRGMQVHRSYWVATRHVVRTARNGKRTTLRLTGDHEVPVSVTHLRTVRALLAR